jgi:hypothetical protein
METQFNESAFFADNNLEPEDDVILGEVMLDEKPDIYDIINAGNHQPERVQNDNLTHYGFAMIVPIPLLADSNAQFYLGNFNPPNRTDPRLGSRFNTPEFDRLRLMPFKTQSYEIPFEQSAEFLNEQEREFITNSAGRFDPGTLKATQATAARFSTISARKWAEQVYAAYKDQGFTLLTSLTGVESYFEAEKMLNQVFNLEELASEFPREVRERFSYEVNPPFITDIIQYLRTFAVRNAKQADDADRAEKLRRELMTAANQGFNFCRTTLTKTEAQIKNGQKVYYDQPDFTRIGARPPLDLLAMMHLNKMPQDEQALAIASAAGESFRQLPPAPVMPNTPPDGFVALADVQKLLDERDAKMLALFGQPTSTPSPSDAATTPILPPSAVNKPPNGNPKGNK